MSLVTLLTKHDVTVILGWQDNRFASLVFLPLECLPVIEAALLSTIYKREPVVKILSSGPSSSFILLFLLLQPWFKNTVRNTTDVSKIDENTGEFTLFWGIQVISVYSYNAPPSLLAFQHLLAFVCLL